jgi:hypothetical protein
VSCSLQHLDRNFRKLRSRTEIEKCFFLQNLSVAKIMSVGGRWINMSIKDGKEESQLDAATTVY